MFQTVGIKGWSSLIKGWSSTYKRLEFEPYLAYKRLEFAYKRLVYAYKRLEFVGLIIYESISYSRSNNKYYTNKKNTIVMGGHKGLLEGEISLRKEQKTQTIK